MIAVEEFKKALGQSANEMSEEDILKLLELQDRMAEILFASWKNKKNNTIQTND